MRTSQYGALARMRAVVENETHEYVDDGTHDDGVPCCGDCGESREWHERDDDYVIEMSRGEARELLAELKQNGVQPLNEHGHDPHVLREAALEDLEHAYIVGDRPAIDEAFRRIYALGPEPTRDDFDWTRDPGTQRSNSSAAFKALVVVVEGLIRHDAFKLISGCADQTAVLIMAQLAHRYGVAPRWLAGSPLTFAKLREVNVARCQSPEGFNHPLGDRSALEWSGAMNGEAGEMADAVVALVTLIAGVAGSASNTAKKIKRLQMGAGAVIPPKDHDLTGADLVLQLQRECADTVIYIDLLLAHVGAPDIGQCVTEKFNGQSDRIGYGGPRL